MAPTSGTDKPCEVVRAKVRPKRGGCARRAGTGEISGEIVAARLVRVQRVCSQSVRATSLLPIPRFLSHAMHTFAAILTWCHAALDGAKNVAPSEQREALLLRARTLIRTLQLPEVVQLLGPQLGTFAVIDEACTARMLHAVGVLRSPGADSVERGSALLAEVHVAALTPKAHPAICGEIEYWIAFGCWMRRDFHATLKHAFVAEGAEADIISVRAASLRGYVAAAKERYGEALVLSARRWRRRNAPRAGR